MTELRSLRRGTKMRLICPKDKLKATKMSIKQLFFNQTIILLLTAQINTYLYSKNYTPFYHCY